MEKVRKVVKKYYLRQIITYWLACWMFFGLPAQVAMAAMNAGNIVSTSQTTGVDFLNPSGSDITTVIAPHQAIIEYSDFNVDALKTLHFDQALATDAVLNRIIEDSPQSNIYGNITALGRVFIVNPAGIVFGSTATVNVAQLVASGLGMSDGAFQAVLADVDNKMEFTGGSGKVENWGTINATDSVYLIGKTVRNHGSILCPDGLVVMAAGNEVKLRQPGSTVIVDMTIDYTGDTDNDINHTGGKIEAKNIALAAGDIWSSALIETETLRAEAKGYVKVDDIINAHDTASSDAVATIDIIAGGNVTVNAEIKAEAVADGVDNATATLTINADGDVDISGNVHTYAFTKDGSGNNNATAKTTVTAANVTIDDGQIGSDAYVENGSGNSTANVDIITTDSDVKVINDSWIWSYAEADGGSGESTSKITIDADNVTVENFSGIYAETEAYDGSGNTLATVDIDADGDVLVKAGADGQSYITSDAYSDDAGDTTATVDIYATGNVLVNASVVDKLSYIGSEASSYEADNAKAETIVDAGGNVIVTGSEGTGRVYAWAHDGSSTNTADVEIIAGGNVEAIGLVGGEAEIEADTWNGTDNISNIYITANDGHVLLDGSMDGVAVMGADAWDGTNNTANVTVTAKKQDSEDIDAGSVIVKAGLGGEAGIDAESWDAENSNSATVTLDAARDVDVEAYNSGEAYVEAVATNDDETNTAKVDITAGRNVELIAQNSADVGILAEAYDGGTNDADVTINATGDVIVSADSKHSTTIIAQAFDGTNNDADVKIDAVGDVSVSAIDGDAKIKALAYDDDAEDDVDAVLNQADIQITGANVNIVSEDSGGWLDFLSPDDALIYAYAHDADENEAGILITATGTETVVENVVSIEGGKVTIESVGQKGDDVLVKAEAMNGNDNTATVGISAASDVEIKAYGALDEAIVKAKAWNEIEPEYEIKEILVKEAVLGQGDEIIEPAEYEYVADLEVEGLTNTAWVGILADENVNIEASGSGTAAVKALAYNEIEVDIHNPDNAVTVNLTVADLENKAGVTISAEGEGVSVNANGMSSKVGIAAEAYNELEFDQHTGGKKWMPDQDAQCWEWWKGHWEDLPAYAAALNLDVTGLVNRSDIGIRAANGNIVVGSQECWFGTEAKITADAYNDFDIDLYTKDGTGSTGDLTLDDLTNYAVIDVAAGYDVEVIAQNGSESGIAALAENILEADEDAEGTMSADNITNNSGVTIDAGGHVLVSAECESDTSDAYIYADALNNVPQPDAEPDNITNTATVDVTAGEDVKVMALDGGHARIAALTKQGVDNTSNVTITTVGGDVLVQATNGKSSRRSGFTPSSASIEAIAEQASNSNTADIQITATATTREYEEDERTYVDVDGGNVEVIAKDGGHAEITAYAADAEAEDREVDTASNNANVTIRTTSAERTTWELVEPPIYTNGDDKPSDEPLEYEKVFYTEGGDVTVKVENGGEAAIKAETKSANENTSDVLICAEGEVIVSDKNSLAFTAKIQSIAQYGNINNAYTGVRGAEGITVLADSGNASIASKAMYGLYEVMPAQQNTAFTSLCTDGDVVVAGMNNGTAEVLSKATDGIVNDAAVGVCADGDVLVAAGLGTNSGTAKIKAEAQAAYYVEPPTEPPVGTTSAATSAPQEPLEPTSATANTVVVSHNGGVGVIDEKYVPGTATASIEAQAHNSNENNAYVGVAAGADLSPDDVKVEPDDDQTTILVLRNGKEGEVWDYLLDEIMPGNVNVEGRGNSAKASIISKAYQGPVNTAETVVCAPGEVVVFAESDGGQPIAQIKSRAGWFGDELSLNDATTRIYASEVDVDVPDLYRGNAIWAYAAGLELKPRVPYTGDQTGYDPDLDQDGSLEFLLTEYLGDYGDSEVVWTEENQDTGTSATLIIQDYSERVDCPTCLPCPDCDLGGPEEPPVGPPAPLGVAPIPALQRILFGQGGCPALMEWLANEVGVAVDVQVFLAGAFVSSTDCQPCETAARLKAAATILTDEDGSHMAAMNQVFTELINSLTLSAPFTPEMADSVAAAFTDPANTGAQYAAAREYIDAFVQYIAILNTEMGSPIGDSVAYVLEKYGSDVEGNPIMAGFLASRLENSETFSQ